MSDPRTGGCQCGTVRYEVAEPPHAIFVCHCTECRKQSASAFGISVFFRSSVFRLLQGMPKKWSRRTGSGHLLDSYFCPECGSRVWDGDKDREEFVCIKGGSLDEALDLGSAVHIWTKRALPGVAIPAHALSYPEEPE
jgi:hypothetical protein